MSYYIISFDLGSFGLFQKRHALLKEAIWIQDLHHLEEVMNEESDSSFFMVDFNGGPRDDIDEYVNFLRQHHSQARIIYIYDDSNAHDLKVHQASQTGGDAYLSITASASEVEDIIKAFPMTKLKASSNRLEASGQHQVFELKVLEKLKRNPASLDLDQIFREAIGSENKKPLWQTTENFGSLTEDDGEGMSVKDEDLSLGGEELELGSDDMPALPVEDEGMELSLDDGMELSLSDDQEEFHSEETEESEEIEEEGLSFDDDQEGDGLELSDEDQDNLSLGDEPVMENLGELDFGDASALSLDSFDSSESSPAPSPNNSEDVSSISLDLEVDEGLSFGGDTDNDLSLDDKSDSLNEDIVDLGSSDLDFGLDDAVEENSDMSDEVREKLKEIDAIMDGSQIIDVPSDLRPLKADSDLDQPLVSEDMNFDNLNFSADDSVSEKEDKPKKKKKEVKEQKETREMGEELREISGAYSGELERTQATISNLRADRDELLAKIQVLEEDKIYHNRQTLTMRAELDEKKIELSIIRRKLNDEIQELKDKLRLHDERRMILEEKNRILTQELDRAGQKNRIDVKKVQMRERELEQKLELLKSDAETQIRNRDLKILELKRKIDAMEFDMESISTQEKRSVESRFELEDKLEKAIKTLRSAITVLEDEGEKNSALEALKKNVDM